MGNDLKPFERVSGDRAPREFGAHA
jgi:hypothetical protein